MANRSSKYSKKISKEEDKFILPFSIEVLDLFCAFAVSDNKNIKRINYIQMMKMFQQIHPDSYGGDQDKLDRVKFIMNALDARLNLKLTNQVMIIQHACGGLFSEDKVKEFPDLTSEEIQYVNATISECIKNAYVSSIINRFGDLSNQFNGTDYVDRKDLINQFQQQVEDTVTYLRKADYGKDDDSYFSLQEDIMDHKIRDYYEELSNPSNKLITGMVGLNELLGGGFQMGRCYMFFGITNEGKSITLLNLAYQIKKYNKNYVTKDPKKKPCIFFLTMENSERETVERLYNISTNPEDMINSNPDKIISDMRKVGGLVISDESPIDIIVKFKETKTCDTTYIEEWIDKLSDAGYEVICVILDYVKRIHCRDVSCRSDIRLELGAVVDDLCSIGKHRDIAMISVSQLNRDATERIDTGREKNKADLLRLLGRSNIGESLLMLENADGSFLIAKEFYPEENRYYMGFQRIKKRYKATEKNHIYQACSALCEIRFVEDVGKAEVQYKDTLRPDPNIAPGSSPKPKLTLNDITTTKDGVMLRNDTSPVSMTPQTQINNILQTRMYIKKDPDDVPEAAQVIAEYNPMFNFPKEKIPCPYYIKD